MLETPRSKIVARCLSVLASVTWLMLCLSTELHMPTFVTTPEDAIKAYAEAFGRLQIAFLLLWPAVGRHDGNLDGQEARIFVLLSVLMLVALGLSAASYAWSSSAYW